MKLSLFTTAICLMASSAMAQHAHSPLEITETGQSQFAAIAEIVTVLRDEPMTDWTQVEITALRDHLVDMDRVTTQATVTRKVDGFSVTFSVTGNESVAKSIKSMVLAHSPMLALDTGWQVAAQAQTNGATMIVTVASQAALDEVNGLGFFGVMTVGAHHQQHHLMIATGRSPH